MNVGKVNFLQLIYDKFKFNMIVVHLVWWNACSDKITIFKDIWVFCTSEFYQYDLLNSTTLVN